MLNNDKPRKSHKMMHLIFAMAIMITMAIIAGRAMAAPAYAVADAFDQHVQSEASDRHSIHDPLHPHYFNTHEDYERLG